MKFRNILKVYEIYNNYCKTSSINPTTQLMFRYQVLLVAFFYGTNKLDGFGSGSKRSAQGDFQKFYVSSAK